MDAHASDNEKLSVSDARNRFNALVADAEREGTITYITNRGGTPVAAIVPADAAEEHEAREDAYWSQQAREVMAAEDSSDAVPLEKVIAALEDGSGKDGM